MIERVRRAMRVQGILPIRRALQLALLVLSAWIAACRAPGPANVTPLDLDPDANQQSLEGHMESYVDQTASLGVQDVRLAPTSAAFVPVRGGVYRQASGAYNKPGWVRFVLRNPTDTRMDRVLTLGQLTIDDVMAWSPDGPPSGFHSGLNTNPADRNPPHWQPRFNVSLGPGEQQQWFVRLVDEGSISTSLSISKAVPADFAWSARTVIDGSLTMVLAWIVFTTCVLGLLERSVIAGQFALTGAGILLAQGFFFWGIPSLMLPVESRAHFSKRLAVLSTVLVWNGLTSVTTNLLRLDWRTHRTARALWAACAVITANSLFMALVVYDVTIPVNLIGMVVGLVLLLGVSIRAAVQGNNIGTSLTFAYAMYLVSYLLFLTPLLGYDSVLISSSIAVTTLLFVSALFVSLQQYARQIRKEHREAVEANAQSMEHRARMSLMVERFVPKEYLQALGHGDINAVRAGEGIEVTMTVLFCDMRGFTTISEHLPVELAFQFVNEWVSEMEPAIVEHGGFVDKYIGDSIMALFRDANTDAALGAAYAMLSRQAAWNEKRMAEGKVPVRIGIGLHTGPLVLGTVGGGGRMSAAVVGDVVNLASRVQETTKRFGTPVVVSESVATAATPSRWNFQPLDVVEIRGRTGSVRLYAMELPPELQVLSTVSTVYEAMIRRDSLK